MVLIECVPVSFSFFLFMVLVVLARLVFLSGLESALGYSLLSSASNCYSFVPTNSIQATSKKKMPIFAFHFSFSTFLLAILRVIVKCKWPMPVLTLSCRIWPAERQIYTLPSIPSTPSSCASRKESSLTPIHKHYAWIKKNSDCAQTFSVQYIDYLHWKTQPTTVSDVQS